MGIFLFIIILIFYIIQSNVIIKFKRFMPIYKESNKFLICEFITQRINNIYEAEIYMGQPPQIIPGFLKTNKYGFTLTNYECPHAVHYYKEKSKTFSYNNNIKYYNCIKFNESLSFYSTINSTNYDIQINNYTITADNYFMSTQCFHIGTQLLIVPEEKNTNLMEELHKRKYIKSYYYEYQIKSEDEIYLILGLNDDFENDNNFKFIKAMIIPYSYQINLKWGLIFQNLYLNNYNSTSPYNSEIKAELDINYGCILGSTDFNKYFQNYLKNNNINVEPKRYEKEYYIYLIDKKYEYIIKNFSIHFYHRELNFNFTFDFKDLFLEKENGYFFLIAFEYDYRNSWKFGFPFFKKYRFIFNLDSKMMGFYCQNGCRNENDNNINNKIIEDTNRYNSNNNSEIKNNGVEGGKEGENKIINKNDINRKFIVLLFFIGIIFVVTVLLFLGMLIGKKIFGIRKAKVNELLELYDYSSNAQKEDKKN